ncbi:dihydroxyacetone kinase subunit DhaL [Microbacterium sp. NPDC058342]|uniref:dihydroxyacetone kinase subunit DhaL n=1 Tax=Microbacterium sp. NPDC058342 TaxID=3346454 RepID=UPI00365D7470
MTENIDGRIALEWISEFEARFARAQERLTDLDRLAGDGDFGVNIASALQRASAALPAAVEATHRSVFAAASRGFMATGGTSGPLFGMWFREISRAGVDEASLSELAAGIAEGLATVRRLGGAKVGDNTMVDALEPAARALSAAAATGCSVRDALVATAEAARAGAESTADLVAAKGRASYVGELSRGVLDPGAVTIALFFEAGADAVGARIEWTPLGELVH